MPGSITIALDVMSGDNGPTPAIAGAIKSLQDINDLKIVLVGDENTINQGLTNSNQSLNSRITIIHTNEFIRMDEDIVSAIRNKKKSSMRLSINQVKSKDAHACVSAGNTGALMAMSMVKLKKINGINRPAIAVLWPSTNINGFNILLDAGADIKADAHDLCQYTAMGVSYAKSGFNIDCLLYTSDAADE